MYIKSLKIINFRKIENIDIQLNKNINVFVGKNAQGKTSILNAIYMLALTKLEKNLNEDELIKKNFLFGKIRGNVKVGRINKKLEVILEKNKKTFKVDGNIYSRVSNYLSNLNVIMFCPDDLDIVKKSPSVRRNLMNVGLCQLYSSYITILNEYNKILKIRNEYIRKNYSNINVDYFEIITNNLIERAILIMNYRKLFVEKINSNISNIYYKIMKQEGLRVEYLPNLPSYDRNDLISFYRDNFVNEIAQKITLFGPHRDDFSFYLFDDDVKIYGSQGQQRVTILALKLSEIAIFKEVKGYYPVVLLDDIFSELDIEKRNNLLKFIKSNIQFVITTTDVNNISSKILDKADVFNLKDGKIMK
jgi:DNA replication and repair protein RecF